MERKTIFRIKTGSHLYGLQRPESDVDYIGVFIPTSDDMFGLKRVNEVDNSTKSLNDSRRNTSEDIDDKMYALPKFMYLLLGNNPNIVELLFATDNVIETVEPEFQYLIDNYDKIISQKVFNTFTRYAFSQKKKLIVKSERYKSLIKATAILEQDFGRIELEDPKRAITEKESSHLNQTLKYYKGQKGNCESFHKGMPLKTIYEKLVEERDNYGWRVKTDTFDTLGYDIKFGYHLIRILSEGEELLRTGRLEYPISGTAREDILKVRNGEVELKELLEMYEKYDALCMKAKEETSIPEEPDFNFANDFLIETIRSNIINEVR